MSSSGSGRERDKQCQYQSGAAKRKAKEERIAREREVLSKVPKISTLFSSQSTACSPSQTSSTNSSASAELGLSQPGQLDEGAHASCGESITRGATSEIEEESASHTPNVVNPISESDHPSSSTLYSTDLGLWPANVTDSMREYWAAKGSEDCINLDADFSASSTRIDGEKYNRQCQKSIFTYTHRLTKEQHPRTWLCYSTSKHAVYCFACKLMTNISVFGKQGFHDWKRASQAIPRHENSSTHREAMIQLLQRRDENRRVDAELIRQAAGERDYWRSVLNRVVETIRFLSERGLAFRGSDEVVGSPKNGNYLGILELLAKFDPFLAQHINHNANKGRGHTSYLSKTICEEFILLMGKRLFDHIIAEVKSAKYFSVSVDSTPDISHIDQLTCIVRYVLPSGPVERFLTFLDMQGHSGQELADRLLQFLTTHGIEIADCHGQSYDNASNMSGKYSGMQAIMRQHCELADYVPCAAHSLNLVGQSAASSCQLAVGFFDFLQRLYSFFAASTHRWKVLNVKLSSKNLPAVKRMSDTRWSARADATEALVKGYDEINAALEEIADDVDQKAEGRQEARGLAAYMNRLETGILAALWNSILHRVHGCSQALQSSNQDLNTAVAIYESLIEYVEKLRIRFEEFKTKRGELSECDHYTEEVKRVRQRNRRNDDPGSVPELPQTPNDRFRTGTFLVILDRINGELRKRLGAYVGIAAKFGFLRKLKDLPDDEMVKSGENLHKAYPTDLEDSLPQELIQFKSLLNTEFAKKSLDAPDPTATSPSPTRARPEEVDIRYSQESLEVQTHKFLVENNLEAVFPNTLTVYRIYLSLMISNCSGERSFSKLKLIKSQLRSSMAQNRLNSLTLLSVENELLRNIDLSLLINDFALKKSRKQNMYKAPSSTD